MAFAAKSQTVREPKPSPNTHSLKSLLRGYLPWTIDLTWPSGKDSGFAVTHGEACGLNPRRRHLGPFLPEIEIFGAPEA